MKLNVSAFSFAVALVVAAAFTVCALLVAIAPEATAAAIGYLLHIDLSGMVGGLTWPSYIAGAVALGLWTALWAAVAAAIYNSLAAA